MKKFCLIYANSQSDLIAKYLSKSQHFNQEYLIKRFSIDLLIEKGSRIPDELLKQAKLFIYQPVKDIHGDRSTQSILNKLPSDCQSISFPSLYFKGYFPQYCKNPVNQVIKPNYSFGVIPHGDTNIISMLKEGKNIPEIIERLSNPNFYSPEFLLANLNETLEELARRESQLSIKVSSFIKEHYQHNYLFHTQNHPTDIVGVYVVNQILKLLNLPSLGDELSIKNPFRGQLENFQIPVYPSVIKHLNLTFANESTVYKHSSFCTNKMTFARYISEYVDLHMSASDSANSYHFQAIKYAKQSKLNKSSEALKKAITIKPSNATYYAELGDVLQKQKKIGQAELAYKKAIELSPDWADFYKSLGDVLIKNNNLQAAILTYKQGLILNPNDAQLYRCLGDALVKKNELDMAEVLYKKAIQIDPTKSYYYRCLGDLFKEKNNLDLAVFNYKKAIELAPKTAYFYSHLGSTLAKQNKLDEAISTCKQATELANKNPNFYLTLGDVQLQKGDIDHALHTYEQAIKLNPNQTKRIFTKLGNLLKEKAEKTTVSHETLTEPGLVEVK